MYKFPTSGHIRRLFYQLLMGSLLGHSTVLKNNNFICVPDSMEPVGDHNCGFSFQKILQGKLDFMFILNVRVGSRLVENDDRSIFQNCSCNRNPLLLAAREFYTLVANPRLIAFRQAHNEIVNLC